MKPISTVTGIEISKDMNLIAQKKLKRFGKRFLIIEDDFSRMKYPFQAYNLIFSCMSLHHIKRPQDKKKIYRCLYSALKKGGVMSLGDPVQDESSKMTHFYENRMKDFIKENYRFAPLLLNHAKKEDFPEKVSNHLRWLKKIGFKNPHLVWKRWNYAVWSAEK